jgi:hypothetical protein
MTKTATSDSNVSTITSFLHARIMLLDAHHAKDSSALEQALRTRAGQTWVVISSSQPSHRGYNIFGELDGTESP